MRDATMRIHTTSSAAGSEALLELADPGLFRANAFRVTGLAVDARARDMARHAKKMDIMKRFGGGGDGSSGPLPLKPAPDEEAIRDAMRRLHDPERRLIDELFWFWPAELGQSASDPALAALARGDVASASKAWQEAEQENGVGDVPTHNLAVLGHALALDWEHHADSTPLQPDQLKRCNGYWRQAFRRWRALLSHDGFWARLGERIRELNDPRLGTDAARRISTSLPEALLGINAQLALAAAEQGKTEECRRHLGLMHHSGFGQEVVDEALRRVLRPVRNRVKMLCDAAKSEADGDPGHADAVARKLLEETREPVAIIEGLLARGNPTRAGAHDEVASTALQCGVGFGNKTEDWRTSLQLLQQTLPVAGSEAVRHRIEANIDIVRGNLQFGTCWFCQRAPATKGAEVEVKMYGEVEHEYTGNGIRTTWKHGDIPVPRCHKCKKLHSAAQIYTGVGCVTGAISGLVVAVIVDIIASAAGHKGLGVPVAIVGAIVGSLIGCAVGYFATLKPTKPESAAHEFVSVKELLSQGYNLGEGPAVS